MMISRQSTRVRCNFVRGAEWGSHFKAAVMLLVRAIFSAISSASRSFCCACDVRSASDARPDGRRRRESRPTSQHRIKNEGDLSSAGELAVLDPDRGARDRHECTL